MDAVILLKEHEAQYKEMMSTLVSGVDDTIKKVLLALQLERIRRENIPHIAIDFTESVGANANGKESFQSMMNHLGAHISAVIPGNKQYMSMFGGDDIDIMCRLRQQMELSGFSEKEKESAWAYLCLLQHIEYLSGKESPISIKLLQKYSSAFHMQSVLEELVDSGMLCEEERFQILSKYSELSSGGPELEKLIMTIAVPLGLNSHDEISLRNRKAGDSIYVRLGKIRDSVLRNTILENIKNDIEDVERRTGRKAAVTICTRGKKKEQDVVSFVEDISESTECLFLTDNIFGISDDYAQLENEFPMRIYGRHETMAACKKIEEIFGYVYVRQKSYTTARDYHLKSRGIWDRILGTDIVKTEVVGEPKPEAKYRKEDIICFPEGYGILYYKGQSTIIQM